MEYSIDVIINLILYCLYLLLFVGTVVGGFVSPALGLQVAGAIVPAIMILTIVWLLITGWDYVIQAVAILISIATNGINFVLGNIATLIGVIWTFVAGMGEAVLAGIQVWTEAKLTFLQSGFESALMFASISLETGYWIVDGAVNLAGVSFGIVAHGIGTVLVTIGYGFGSVVVILLNLVASMASSLTMLVGAGPTLAGGAGGAVALVALPYIVQLLLTLIAHSIHLASRLILRVTWPAWRSSWLLGWVAKMLIACITLAFYLERSAKHRPIITINWDGQQWTVAH